MGVTNLGARMRREELTQFECHLCGEGSILDHFQKCPMIIQAESTQIFKDIPSGHYHTKRKLQLLELPGYQFADPCPPSVRSVAFSISPVVVFYCVLVQLKISDLSGVDIPWRFLTKVSQT